MGVISRDTEILWFIVWIDNCEMSNPDSLGSGNPGKSVLNANAASLRKDSTKGVRMGMATEGTTPTEDDTTATLIALIDSNNLIKSPEEEVRSEKVTAPEPCTERTKSGYTVLDEG